MKRVEYICKNLILWILNIIFHVFWLYKIDYSKILFMSYSGEQYACSPRYISEYLAEKYKNKFKIIWVIKDERLINKHDYIVVRPKTCRYFYHLLTAKFIVHNVYIPPWLPYRKAQNIINTWHGGGVCKLPYADFDKLSWYNKRLLKSGTKYFISSSKKFTDMVIRGTFNDQREVLEIGLPRNDQFFVKDDKYPVHEFYKLDNDIDIILYAPTYRDKESKTFVDLDTDNIIYEWEMKTGKRTVLLWRPHPFSKINIKETQTVLDGRKYLNMQDILKESSCYITDYSSAIWDWCLMKKPCLLYIPDELEYEMNRKMYLKPSEFNLPFCRTNQELVDIIKKFTLDDYIQADNVYLDFLGTFEKGDATKRVVEIIVEQMNIR